MNFLNETIFTKDPEISCFILKLIGLYMLILLIASTIFNSLNLWIFYKAKLMTPINCYMLILLSFNLVATYFEAPLMILNALNCKLFYNFF